MVLKNVSLRYDEKFFQDVLQEYSEDRTIRVYAIDVTFATDKGDNFMSDIYRVLVKYSRLSENKREVNGTRFLIVKCAPSHDGEMKKYFDEQKIFPTELKVLQQIVTRIRQDLGTQLGPQVFHWVETVPQAIVMEDLTARGFIVKNKQHGLSLNHATLAIQNLAKFHAGSVAICEENPELVKGFNMGILSEKVPPNVYGMIEDGFMKLSKVARTWHGSRWIQLSRKIEAFAGRSKQCLEVTASVDPDEFCVLNHGDCWVNNMLFRENEKGEPCEHLFVDFQMSVYTSPAMDVLYFLGNNPNLDLKGDADDTLLQRYLDTLTTTMKSLNCTTVPPTMEHLRKAMLKRRAFGLFCYLIFYPRLTADVEVIQTVQDFIKSGKTPMAFYEPPLVVATMQKLIPILDDRGYFD